MCIIPEVWEYFTPDPEVEEALVYVMGRLRRQRVRRGLLAAVLPADGFRLGAGGRPDDYQAARERSPPGLTAECVGCGRDYVVRWDQQRYCSRGCLSRSRRLPHIGCATCGRRFKPVLSRSKYCSRACTPSRGGLPAMLDREEFSRVYRAGLSLRLMATRFGVGEPAVCYWRDKFGLPRRKK
jgi:hypothetical protein